jgi:hypothetical protein
MNRNVAQRIENKRGLRGVLPGFLSTFSFLIVNEYIGI